MIISGAKLGYGQEIFSFNGSNTNNRLNVPGGASGQSEQYGRNTV